jgi:hypothetical protein
LRIKNAGFVYLFIFFSPYYFKLIFSGLTEYLFGLFLILGIYLISKSKHALAAIIISFLPLIRSEGLIILGVFGLYFVLEKKIKHLPYLLFGQLIYTAFGAFYYGDLLWVFNKIPYAHIGSPYGSGGFFDFVHRLNYVIEKPIYLLLALGAIAILISFFQRGWKDKNTTKVILIFGSFFSLFAAHTLFWWLGVFNSMGLPRVLIAVVPVIAIVALMGVELLTSWFKNPKVKMALLIGITFSVCVFPFTPREQGVVFNSQLFVSADAQLMDQEIVPYIQLEIPDYATRILYTSQPYLSMALKIDFFDTHQYRELHHLFDSDIPKGSIVVWDDWFSIIQGQLPLSQLTDDPRFELIQTFKGPDHTLLFAVFISRENIPIQNK